jgi:hypothetical protein
MLYSCGINVQGKAVKPHNTKHWRQCAGFQCKGHAQLVVNLKQPQQLLGSSLSGSVANCTLYTIADMRRKEYALHAALPAQLS